MRTRIVYAGASVGYGATWQSKTDTPLAVISAGYADGIFRSLSNRGVFWWRGYACPIRGRVSMDMTTVDLSAIPAAERPRPGDFLDLIGPDQDADRLATAAGTIGYEILTSLGGRYQRAYINSLQNPHDLNTPQAA
jgi:alanine racemase